MSAGDEVAKRPDLQDTMVKIVANKSQPSRVVHKGWTARPARK
jgi:hypothetical protein